MLSSSHTNTTDVSNLAPHLTVLSGELPFKGKFKPVSLAFLVHLSIRCRQRVLEFVEAAIMGDVAILANTNTSNPSNVNPNAILGKEK